MDWIVYTSWKIFKYGSKLLQTKRNGLIISIWTVWKYGKDKSTFVKSNFVCINFFLLLIATHSVWNSFVNLFILGQQYQDLINFIDDSIPGGDNE